MVDLGFRVDGGLKILLCRKFSKFNLGVQAWGDLGSAAVQGQSVSSNSSSPRVAEPRARPLIGPVQGGSPQAPVPKFVKMLPGSAAPQKPAYYDRASQPLPAHTSHIPAHTSHITGGDDICIPERLTEPDSVAFHWVQVPDFSLNFATLQLMGRGLTFLEDPSPCLDFIVSKYDSSVIQEFWADPDNNLKSS